MLSVLTQKLSLFIAGEPLLGRLALASLELAGFALLVWLFQRFVIRSHRFAATLWLLVMIEPLLCLALSIPAPFRLKIAALEPPVVASIPKPLLSGAASKNVHGRNQDKSFEVLEAAGPADDTPQITAGASTPRAVPLASPAWRLPALPTLFSGVWLGGVLVMAGLAVFNYRQLRCALVRTREPSPAMKACYHAAARSLGFDETHIPCLRVGHLFESPAIVGFLRPVILMPEWLAGEEDAEKTLWALRHELTHWRLGHPLVSGLRGVVQVLFFFHPLAWWAGRHWEAAAELTCDRMLLESKADVAHYTLALVAMLEAVRRRRDKTLALGMFASRTQIGRRIAALMSNPLLVPNHLTLGRRLLLAVCGAVVLISGGVGLGFKPATAGAQQGASIAADGGRIFKFPPANATGVLYVRPAGSEATKPWRWLSACEGEVKVPPGMELRLRMIPGSQNPAGLLESFGPNDLAVLDCATMEIADDLLPEIARLGGLRSLDLEGTKVTDDGLARLRGLGALEELSLRSCTGIQGPGLVALADLGNLKRLDLSAITKTNDNILSFLAGCKKLEVLLAQHLGRDGDNHALLANLPELLQLKELDLLDHPNLTDAELNYLKRVPRLERLRLCATGVTDAGMPALAALRDLQMLVLERTKVSGKGLASLAALPKLTHLSLRMSPVTDTGMEGIGQLASLQVLDLDLCQISGRGLDQCVKLQNVEELYLNGSNIGEPAFAKIKKLMPKLRRLACVADAISDPAQAPLASSKARLKVGVVVSHFTATGPSWSGRPYGFGNMQLGGILAADFGYTTYGIIDPGTAAIKEVKNSLHKLGVGRRTIEANDVEALKKLDVIVMAMVHNAPDVMLQSITEAVRNGTGLVVLSATGVVTPGAENKAVQTLLGIADAKFHWRGANFPNECTVLKSHPVLVGLSPGDCLTVETLDGFSGTYEGEPLLGTALGDNSSFKPLFVRQLGKGRCVYYQSPLYNRRGLVSTWDEFRYDREDWILQMLDHAIEWTAASRSAQGQ